MTFFEHEERQPIHFDDRPRIDTERNGRERHVAVVERGRAPTE